MQACNIDNLRVVLPYLLASNLFEVHARCCLHQVQHVGKLGEHHRLDCTAGWELSLGLREMKSQRQQLYKRLSEARYVHSLRSHPHPGLRDK